MTLVIHSYGFWHVFLRPSQEDDAHIKKLTKEDISQIIKRASFVYNGLEKVGASQDNVMVYSFIIDLSVSGIFSKKTTETKLLCQMLASLTRQE